MENPVILGEVRTVGYKEQKDPSTGIPKIYKILFIIQLICLAIVGGLAYSVV